MHVLQHFILSLQKQSEDDQLNTINIVGLESQVCSLIWLYAYIWIDRLRHRWCDRTCTSCRQHSHADFKIKHTQHTLSLDSLTSSLDLALQSQLSHTMDPLEDQFHRVLSLTVSRISHVQSLPRSPLAGYCSSSARRFWRRARTYASGKEFFCPLSGLHQDMDVVRHAAGLCHIPSR